MKKIFLILCVLIGIGTGDVFAAPAVPATMFVSTNPTTLTDGTPLFQGDLSRATIYCGTEPGVYDAPYVTTNQTKLVPGLEITVLFNDTPFKNGTFYCALTTTSASGAESAYSNEIGPLNIINGVIPVVAPNAPSNFSVR